ncbi:hypothetical protein A2U01_0009774, partial [Trifolium medium]|nr:hypothetical protein [Trifolium medium]
VQNSPSHSPERKMSTTDEVNSRSGTINLYYPNKDVGSCHNTSLIQVAFRRMNLDK